MTYLTTRRLAEIDRLLSDRDRAIIQSVGALRLASGEQLRRLYFAEVASRDGGRRSNQLALSHLVKIGALKRLERRIGGKKNGSDGYVYGLGAAGARLVLGDSSALPRRTHEFGGPFVAHTLACSQVYVELVHAAKHGQVEVLDFQSEPDSWRKRLGPSGSLVTLRPDGFVRLGLGQLERHWFIEVDRGTENQPTIARQGRAYLDHFQSGAEAEIMPRVAWLTTSAERATQLTRTLHRLGGIAQQLFVVGQIDDAVSTLLEVRS